MGQKKIRCNNYLPTSIIKEIPHFIYYVNKFIILFNFTCIVLKFVNLCYLYKTLTNKEKTTKNMYYISNLIKINTFQFI